MKTRCPVCGSADTRRSQTHGLIDGFWTMFSRVPFRCRACNSRFHGLPYQPPEPSDEAEEPDEPNSRQPS